MSANAEKGSTLVEWGNLVLNGISLVIGFGNTIFGLRGLTAEAETLPVGRRRLLAGMILFGVFLIMGSLPDLEFIAAGQPIPKANLPFWGRFLVTLPRLFLLLVATHYMYMGYKATQKKL